MIGAAEWLTGGAAALVVVVCVLLHYEGLHLLTDHLPRSRWNPRPRMIVLIFTVLLLHIIEIWIFGLSYWFFLTREGFGELSGATPANLFDCVYFSAVTFSTVGFGDRVPTGPLRVIVGIEAVAGLTLITWSASYTFVEMLKTWQPKND